MENDQITGVFQAMYLLTNVQLVENGELEEKAIPVKKETALLSSAVVT